MIRSFSNCGDGCLGFLGKQAYLAVHTAADALSCEAALPHMVEYCSLVYRPTRDSVSNMLQHIEPCAVVEHDAAGGFERL